MHPPSLARRAAVRRGGWRPRAGARRGRMHMLFDRSTGAGPAAPRGRLPHCRPGRAAQAAAAGRTARCATEAGGGGWPRRLRGRPSARDCALRPRVSWLVAGAAAALCRVGSRGQRGADGSASARPHKGPLRKIAKRWLLKQRPRTRSRGLFKGLRGARGGGCRCSQETRLAAAPGGGPRRLRGLRAAGGTLALGQSEWKGRRE
ncbi:MAG: hypothetical protein J3K34DRAFT_436276 [Monoraphidium minutum]|nr:MAG: hypothetical protein J3K34DRAFT_436276 [Monoraphidium minutum]